MNDTRIFGPFNIKQTFALLVGFSFVYLAYNNLNQAMSYPLIAIIIYFSGLFVFKNGPRSYNLEELKTLILTDRGRGLREVQKKIAEVLSVIRERELKGFVKDPLLDAVLEDLRKLSEQNLAK